MRWGGATLALAGGFARGLRGCATPPPKAPPIRINEDPYPSTYARYPGAVTVIRGATVFDGEGGRIDNGVGGAGRRRQSRRSATRRWRARRARIEIDGTGKFVTPGIIDVHSHLGDYPEPGHRSA